MVPGLELPKYFYKEVGKYFKAANPAYDPIELDLNEVVCKVNFSSMEENLVDLIIF